jgi:hypothetical protein
MDGKVLECPCRVCLLKPVCLEICDKLNEYHTLIFGFDHEEIRNV